MAAGATSDFVHLFEPAAAAGAPTLVLLHGTGGDERALLPLGRVLVPGAALLSPRGQVLEGAKPRFFRRVAEGVFDLDDLRRRAHGLADFIGACAAHYGFDPARVAAAGFSNGANIASSVMLLRPGLLRGAALFSPMVPFEPDPPPDLGAAAFFINGGRHDPLVDPATTQALADLLTRCGARVTLRWTEGGHAIADADAAAAAAWFRTAL
jgi:phospholipase/carboxylesterase/glyoxalase family protein